MRASRAEILIEEILKDNNIVFEQEYTMPGLAAENGTPLRFDFAVFDDDGNIDFFIEYQGRQHYEAVSKFGGRSGLAAQQHNDRKKLRYCELNGYKLVVIPYTEEKLITYDYILRKAGY